MKPSGKSAFCEHRVPSSDQQCGAPIPLIPAMEKGIEIMDCVKFSVKWAKIKPATSAVL